MKLRKTLVLAGISLAVTLIFSELLFTIVAVNLMALITVMGLQVIVTRWPVEPLEQNFLADEPFVSIHVPAHNEPPELVNRRLKAEHAQPAVANWIHQQFHRVVRVFAGSLARAGVAGVLLDRRCAKHSADLHGGPGGFQPDTPRHFEIRRVAL
jgi:hypothetical protein